MVVTVTTKEPSFGPELFSFLADLRANNNREWFAANRERYEEHLLEPALDFVEAFAPRLEKISPHFRAEARPSGGSLFRIHRDTRFSKDKSPYKTNLGIHFRHERAKVAHAPGYYLHIGPGEVFAGGGVWHPGTEAATRIREGILADDLRRKDFFGGARLSESDVVAPDFVDEYARICRAAAPLMQFLCDALEV